MANLIKIDKNGTKYYEGYIPCDRCGGAGGADQWKFTGFTCYKCGGNGKIFSVWKEYTPEHEAKLAEQRRKRAEKRDAELAEKLEQESKRKEEEEAKAKEEEKRINEEKAKSQYYGNIGEKIEVKAIYKFSAWYECKSFSGFGTETHYIHTFKAGDNTLVWKTTCGLGLDKETEVTLKGTVKDHNEYNDEKQTILTRCRVKGV